MSNPPLCPIREDGRSFCIKERCAWWLAFANDCAVPIATAILYDSTICQNKLENSVPEKELEPESEPQHFNIEAGEFPW